MLEVVLKRFENPDETRHFEKGRFEIVNIGDEMYISLHFLGADDYTK